MVIEVVHTSDGNGAKKSYDTTTFRVSKSNTLGSVSSSRPEGWDGHVYDAVQWSGKSGGVEARVWVLPSIGLRRHIPRCRKYRKRRLNESRPAITLWLSVFFEHIHTTLHPIGHPIHILSSTTTNYPFALAS